MADIVTPIPTGPIIPQEYQDQIDQARRKQMIAQMLSAQAMNFKGPQQIGPVAAKISPLAGLANVAQAGLGGMLDASAMTEGSNAKRQFETDQNADLQKIFAAPEAQQSQVAQTSIFPQNQAIGRALQAQQEKRREELAKIVGTAGDTQGAAGIINGSTPVGGYTPKVYPDPTIISMPDPADPSGKHQIQYIQSYDKYGKKSLAPAAGNTVTVNLPNKEGELARTREQDQLASMQSQAHTALGTLATTDRLTQALQEGAQIGGGADLKQTARKIFQAVGIDLPETGPTDVARTQFGAGMLANINKLGRNPTDYDEKLMQRLIGSLETDPNAAPQLIAFMAAQAHKSLQDYNDFIAEKRNGQAAKTFPDLYDTADVGLRNQPKTLTGPLPLQAKVIEALKQAGGDITRFKDPSGQPFSPDAKFDIKVPPITPASVTPPAGAAPVIPPNAKIYENKQTGERGTYINGVWTILPKQ